MSIVHLTSVFSIWRRGSGVRRNRLLDGEPDIPEVGVARSSATQSPGERDPKRKLNSLCLFPLTNSVAAHTSFDHQREFPVAGG